MEYKRVAFLFLVSVKDLMLKTICAYQEFCMILRKEVIPVFGFIDLQSPKDLALRLQTLTNLTMPD